MRYINSRFTYLLTYFLGDGRETSDHGVLIISDKLVAFDLQQLSFALHMKSLEALASTERRVQVSVAYNNTDCTRV